jgi:anaerobic ribonucleoside-triphosphate reductase activating protein
MNVNVGARVHRTEAEGPGARYALWVKGCSIRCPGCCNPHLFEAEPADEVSVDELVDEILDVDELDGVTFLGGEPFDQAAALGALAAAVRAGGLSVMVFSGYRIETLRRQDDAGVEALLAHTDLLVDGPYVEALHQSDRRWIGSSNQRAHFLSERYEHLRQAWDPRPNTVELRIVDGAVQINGFPEPTITRLTDGQTGGE